MELDGSEEYIVPNVSLAQKLSKSGIESPFSKAWEWYTCNKPYFPNWWEDFCPQPPKVKKIIVNKNVMVVIWDDGTKNRATCSGEDKMDYEIGFAVCLMKHLYGKKKLAKMLKKITVIGEKK
jgi:hypothetical protein